MRIVTDKGFSLIEMMIAMVVLAILIVVGAPAFSELIKNNRMLSNVYGMRAALNNARSEALAQRAPVIFCASNDGATCVGNWDEGYIAFIDFDNDEVLADPNDVFFSKVIDADYLEKFTYTADGKRVRFDGRGFARRYPGTFTLCDDRDETEARGVIVAPGGIVRAAMEDPNDPGIVRDDGGAELDCS